MNDETTSFDIRFRIRGEQPARQDIVIVNIRALDLSVLMANPISDGKPSNLDFSDLSDTSFWNKDLWLKILSSVLKQDPKSIAVTLYFGENIPSVTTNLDEDQILKNPKVFWSTFSSDRPFTPRFAKFDYANVGLLEFNRDEDGVLRRFISPVGEKGTLAEKWTSVHLPSGVHIPINFRGNRNSFLEYSIQDVLQNRINLKNKYVILNADTNSNYLTPKGFMNRAEVLAQISDNLLDARRIYRAHPLVYVIELLGVMLMAIWFMMNFPASVGLVVFIWIGILNSVLSAWVFDRFYIWLPMISIWIQLLLTWLVLVVFQAYETERRNWALQQERILLNELEQLKNNFVSLISHDLKTPIAKIQAVVDRLLVKQNELPESAASDLQSVRQYGDELNRYIQSILKVLRVESRDFKLNKEVADINEIIEAAISSLQPLAQDKNIQIKAELEPLFTLEFDVTLVKEVVINLVENAIKYTPPSGTVVISSHETDNFVEVLVTDTGEGISPEELGNIWGKFVRGKNQDMKTKGSGLGLYLVKYFIELHGGSVSMTSTLGKGTTVGFKLPLDGE